MLPLAAAGARHHPQGHRRLHESPGSLRRLLMEPSHIDRKRVGNFMLDFNFKRDTLTTGWKFGALIVVIHDKEIYKQ